VIRLLQDTAAQQASARGDAVALVMGDERLTYAGLEEASNRLARLLLDAGCSRGDRVCLFQQKTPDAIVSELATLKADCAYVPIDVSSPAARVAKIVESADPSLLLAGASSAGLVAEVLELLPGNRPRVAVVDAGSELDAVAAVDPVFVATDLDAQSPEAVPQRNGPDDAAHILFTSGSTGTPKGVVITHEMVTAFIEWATRHFGTGPGDRISGHPPLHFDLSTFDIYGTFLAGAELHLVPAQLNLVPHRLAEFIRRSELTQWFAVPSIFAFMAKFDAVEQDDFPTLERVLWCGEVLPTPVLIHWMRRLPHAVFTNLYGPTEATIASSYYTVSELPASETDSIPIGRPCDGEELLVLDAELHELPEDEIGDLYIAGVGLSPGYWRDEEKTAAAFLPDPRPGADGRIYRTGDLARVGADGLVYFLGRADSQIKHRGYRIELGEIETALNAVDEIGECAVVGVETGGFEGTAICCAYACAAGRSIELTELKERLRTMLPAYMLPGRWTVLDVLPKNVNGKIDRRRVREDFERAAAETAGAAI
jgi:amino acid adenylation domain-containing protein